MKFVAGILITGILTAICLGFLPWWVASIFAFAITYLLRLGPWQGFVAGFLGVALAWGGMAWWLDVQNQSILSARIGALFMGMSSIMVIVVTGLVGGISGGLGGVTGSLFLVRMRGRNSNSNSNSNSNGANMS